MSWRSIKRELGHYHPVIGGVIFFVLTMVIVIPIAISKGDARKAKEAEQREDSGVSTISEYPYPIYKLPIEEGYIIFARDKYEARGCWAIFVPNPEPTEEEED